MNGKDIHFELDTGASFSVMPFDKFRASFPDVKLTPSKIKLKSATYTGEELKIVGQVVVKVTYGERTYKLPLQIIRGSGPSLFGWN